MPRWTKSQLGLLGRMTDREVAEKTGRKLSAVTQQRTKLGIPASQPRAYTWSAEEDALLGTMTDQRLAEELGVSRRCVLLRRQALGIAAHGKRAAR